MICVSLLLMLAESKKFITEKLSFKLSTIEEFANSESKWNLIFSNAALQWSNEHEKLFPKLISKINENGQLAVQMPFQKENLLNKLLLDMVSERSFADLLEGFRQDSPLLQIDDYARIMFECGLKDLNILLKVYPIIAANETELYNFISGSALIPYMERLDPQEQELFKTEFIKMIKKQFGSFLPFTLLKEYCCTGSKNNFPITVRMKCKC